MENHTWTSDRSARAINTFWPRVTLRPSPLTDRVASFSALGASHTLCLLCLTLWGPFRFTDPEGIFMPVLRQKLFLSDLPRVPGDDFSQPSTTTKKRHVQTRTF